MSKLSIHSLAVAAGVSNLDLGEGLAHSSCFADFIAHGLYDQS
jgi:hypothetical protein